MRLLLQESVWMLMIDQNVKLSKDIYSVVNILHIEKIIRI